MAGNMMCSVWGRPIHKWVKLLASYNVHMLHALISGLVSYLVDKYVHACVAGISGESSDHACWRETYKAKLVALQYVRLW